MDKNIISICELIQKTSKLCFKYVLSDDANSIINRLRLRKISSNLDKISELIVVPPLRNLERTPKEIKINLLSIMSSIKLVCSLGYFRSLASGSQTYDLPADALDIASTIEEYLFKIVEHAPELIVRPYAVNYLSDRDKLIFLASGKDNTTEVRLNAIKKIACNNSDDQAFLKSIVEDKDETLQIRNEALHRITDKTILKSFLGNSLDYDVLFLGVVMDQLRKSGS